MATKTDLSVAFNRLRLKQEVMERQINMILENQQIIMQQNLFIMDYLIGDDEKREQIKKDLGLLFQTKQERTLQ
ncbi:MAG: hypothetical protein J6M43_04420 [Neisseriaceae bacterium]|nr:hypothetical protein [Neisseriaceae bacterium]